MYKSVSRFVSAYGYNKTDLWQRESTTKAVHKVSQDSGFKLALDDVLVSGGGCTESGHTSDKTRQDK